MGKRERERKERGGWGGGAKGNKFRWSDDGDGGLMTGGRGVRKRGGGGVGWRGTEQK